MMLTHKDERPPLSNSANKNGGPVDHNKSVNATADNAPTIRHYENSSKRANLRLIYDLYQLYPSCCAAVFARLS